MDKVIGGTPKGNIPLCFSCRRACIAEGYSPSQVLIHCYQFEKEINFSVYECSEYIPKNQRYEYELEQIAWVIRSRNRGPMGYVGDGKTQIVIDPPDRKKGITSDD